MSETILYVDDDLANLVVFEATCEDEFDVVTATSGEEAIKILGKRQVAVLLLDQRMPGKSGTEIAQYAFENFPDTVRILMTAYSDLPEAIEAVNRGHIRTYLRKPWDKNELTAVLRDAVDVHQTKVEVKELQQRLIETERVYALGLVAAGIAHELRNPLTVLLATQDLLVHQVDEIIENTKAGSGFAPGILEGLGELSEIVNSSQQAIDRMIEITRGMELSNRQSVGDDSADVTEVVRLTLKSVSGSLVRVAKLTEEVDTVPRVVGNKQKLGQVALNLLVNALQAFPDASDPADNRVSVSLKPVGDQVELVIEDNGPGIPEEVASRLFDPFFTTKARGGTGLGLAISKSIVEESGGSIELNTEIGRGTRFIVRLAVAKD